MIALPLLGSLGWLFLARPDARRRRTGLRHPSSASPSGCTNSCTRRSNEDDDLFRIAPALRRGAGLCRG
ncbi:hypothetical protein JRG18_05725 [Kocuria palustris]|nr:hypothetical protein [Kocuria palustris]MBN6757981.1 hypothetical protein [Kocuria palustris]MBN6763009.1 hypothetical protein [Kocuria palustris]MBN6782450.1 hypothetical protein [Kocuria palustris]MBN6799408.1 hypothetical protein [Kocuria palustris]